MIRYFLSDILLTFMFFRIIIPVKTILKRSIYINDNSKYVCQKHKADYGLKFAFKCLLEEYPTSLIISIFIVNIFVLTYMFRIFEIPYHYMVNRKTYLDMSYGYMYLD